MGHKYALLVIGLGASLSACSTLIPRKTPPGAEPTAQPAAAQTAPSEAAPTAAAPTPASAGAPTGATPPAQAQISDLQTTVHTLNSKVEALEMQLASMTDKLEAAKLALEAQRGEKLKSAAITHPPVESGGTRVTPTPVKTDPEFGFSNDDPVQDFRKAMILMRTQKFPEAVLAFSGFLERFPDHPLAGSAQYHVGEAYFLQKEYKLALSEYHRVLTSYDRSPLVARTLHDMVIAEEKLNKVEDAARHRQQLMSLFPHSPFAVVAGEKKEAAPALKNAPSSKPEPARHNAFQGDADLKSEMLPASLDDNDNVPTMPLGKITQPAQGKGYPPGTGETQPSL